MTKQMILKIKSEVTELLKLDLLRHDLYYYYYIDTGSLENNSNCKEGKLFFFNLGYLLNVHNINDWIKVV